MIELSSDDSVEIELPLLSDAKLAATKRKIVNLDSSSDSQQSDYDLKVKKQRTAEIMISPGSLNALNFYYTKVLTDFDDNFNHHSLTLSCSDILSKRFGQLKKSAQFNFLFDVNWLMKQYDPEFRSLPLTLIAQNRPETKDDLIVQASSYPNIRTEFVLIPSKFGCHHTKMMLLQYETGIRVVILTSNMIESDWNQKTQAIWMSDLLPPLPSDALSVDTSKTHFKTDLLEYLQTYRLPSINFWIALIKRHDFSSVNVFLIGSVPGTHSGPKLNSFGHMKLRQLLRQHCPASITSNWGTVAQFSSIGSLGKKPDQWLTGEFEQTLNTTKSNRLASKSAIKLVFPTVENVRKSLEGYIAGRSLPYRKEIDDRQLYLRSFMHKWSSNHINRSRASPHIKSYFRHSPEYSKVAWFVLTSANLSKAAWGQLQKKGVQLSILSYELGVLFVPSMFSNYEYFELSTDKQLPFAIGPNAPKLVLPVNFPLSPYSERDEPWIQNLNYKEPDTHGNIWIPTI